MKPLSHSQISLYLQCPLKYKLRYVDGLKEKPKSYLSFGKSVHDALEYIFRTKLPIPPSLDDVIEYYKRNWIKEGYKDEQDENNYFKYGGSIIQEFYNKHTKPYKRPMAVEHDMFFDIDGIKVRAIMDRIDKLSDDSVEIIDYKTSKDPFSLSDLVDEPQLTMYQFAVETEMGLKVEKLTYYHLPSQTPFTVSRHSDEKVEDLRKRIIYIADKIRNEDFPHKQNKFCPCDFEHLCPLYIHGHKKEEEKNKKAIDIVKVADEYGKLKDQDKDISARAKALQQEVKEYMDKEKVERIFGDKYEITRSKSTKEMLNTTKAKEILKEKELLNNVIFLKETETIRYKEKKVLEEN